MATKKSVKRGRPQLYPLTASQFNSIQKRLAKGEKPKEICEALDVHPYAVLRVKRNS
jgi:hypothetical protein